MSIKTLVGISGGVDSSYVLSLLKSEGRDVTGAYLIFNDWDKENSDARKCAEEVGVSYVEIDVRKEFKKIVVGNFIDEYIHGRTPNPCIVCNREIKIEYLTRYAKENGFDTVATGHYAKIIHKNGEVSIYRGDDKKKDQSYMLWRLKPEQINMLEFPLGDSCKDYVRTAAESAGLTSASKKDSLDICFIPSGDHYAFLESALGPLPSGEFMHADGRKLGKSKHICAYTVGQRKGLGLAMDRSVFVTKLDYITNTVTVDYSENLFSHSFIINNVNYISQNIDPDDLYVKIRYAAEPVGCKVEFCSESCAVVTVQKPCRAVTPGQSAVFYNSEGKMLFGGYITSKG